MGLYDRHVLPRIIDLACRSKPAMRQREKIVPQAHGRVLEIGVGSGLNFPYYDPSKVSKVFGLDPSRALVQMARRAVPSLAFEVEFLEQSADAVALDDDSVDSAVVTYTLCTIAHTSPALREVARVLRPGGELVFCEHGEAPDDDVRRWQQRLNPLWTRIGGGCNLNRRIPGLIEAGGFRIKHLDTMYIPGWRPASFNYWGSATPG